MDVGALSLLIGESGFAATMQKVAQLDAAAAKVGAKPAELKVTAPSVAPVQASLTKLQQTASGIAGQQVSFRFNVSHVAQATAALGQATQATAGFSRATANLGAVSAAVVPQQAANTAATQQNTQAAQQNTQATQQQAAAQQKLGTSVTAAGNASQAMSPKVRSAANGVAALAFAATSVTPNFQSMALAAGLVASSLADAFGPGKIALYASGIGALVALGGVAIGMWQRMTAASDSAARSAARVGSAPDVESAERRYGQLTRTLEGLRREYDVLAGKSLLTTTLADSKRLSTLSNEIAAFEKAQQDAFAGVEDRRREQTRAVAAAQREAGVAAANDQLRVTTSLIDRQESLNQQAYALGIINLRDYFNTRVKIAQERSEATIRALEAERRALSVAPVGEKPDEAIARTSRRDSVSVELEAERTRQRTAEQAFLAEREAAERALAQRIAGFQRQILEAQGQTHQARLAQIDQEVAEFERALAVDPTRDPATKAALVTSLREALTAQENFNNAQRESERIFSEIAREREAIQQRVDRHQISELDGEREIAAAERARLPELQKLAAAMLAFATELKNPELVESAKRLIQALGARGANPFTVLEQQLNDSLEQIERSTLPGAKKIAAAIRKAIAEQNIEITPRVSFEVDAIAQAIGQLEQVVGGLALNVGNAIGSSLAEGFSASLTKGSGKNFAEAFGNAMLKSIGGIMVQLGSAMLTYGLIMAIAAPLLAFTPFKEQAISAPAAIAAGTGLIALGSGLGAIASNNTGSRTGGGAGGRAFSAPRAQDAAPQRVLLDPDRPLRERSAVAPTVTASPNARASVLPPPVVIENLHAYGTPTPQLERLVAASNRGADGRNIPTTRKRKR